MISGRGKAHYAFVKLASSPEIKIQDDLTTIRLPNATPEIVLEYAGTDEQGILAKVHYNRLLDIFGREKGIDFSEIQFRGQIHNSHETAFSRA